MKFSGSDWLARTLGEKLTPLATEAADVLGQVYQGIYHLPRSNWEPKRWKDPRFVWATVPGGISTVDGFHLTALVVLCHDRRLRVEISSAGPRDLRLTFHPRPTREGGIAQRCPHLERHVATIRAACGLGIAAEAAKERE